MYGHFKFACIKILTSAAAYISIFKQKNLYRDSTSFNL
jgi:hypothetical protein